MELKLTKKITKKELERFLSLIMELYPKIVKYPKYKSLKNKNNIFIIHPNGFIMFRIEDKIIILEIHVDKKYRGLGIGTFMLIYLKSLYKGKYVLYVHRDNKKAINFYKKNGFKIDNTETYNNSDYYGMSYFS